MKEDISLILSLFYDEIIPEAQEGCIYVDDWQYHCHFTTQIGPTSKPSDYVVLHIHNQKKFEHLLCTYAFCMMNYLEANPEFSDNDAIYFFNSDKTINKKLTYKAICTFLWANATFDDFLEPENYLQNRIAFFNDPLYSSYKDGKILFENLEAIFPAFQKVQPLSLKVKIVKQNPVAENLYALETYLVGHETYILPKIYYGINNGICYIGTIQKKKQNRQKFHKDIERILYKFDHKIPEEYKNIEPNILLALICFFLILKKENISTIIYNAYYPLRNELKAYLVKKEKISEQEYYRIFQNITLRYFEAIARLQYQFEGIEIQSYPFDFTTSMKINLTSITSKLDDNLLNQIVTSINCEENLQRK